MKRLLLLIYAMMFSLCMMHAGTGTGMLYKLWMVEDINKGHFEKAAKEMTYVDDWSFDIGDQRAFVQLEKAIQFIDYADSIGVPKALVDSMRLYTNDECFLFSNYHHNTGDFQKAMTIAHTSVQLVKQVYGELHPIYATVVNNLGLEYLMLDDVAAAEHYFLQATEIRHTILPPDDPDYALSLRNLGDVYFGMGDFDVAENYYLQAYDIYQSYNAPSDEQLIYLFQLLNNLGNLNLQRKAYQSAEEYYFKAREIYDTHRGPLWEDEQINNGALQMGLGDVCLQRTGDYSRTAAYYFKALEIYEQVNAPLYLRSKTFMKLGKLYRDRKDYEQAEKYFKLVLILHEDSLVKNKSLYTETLGSIGTLYLESGNYAQAETYYKRCYDIFSSEYIKSTSLLPERQRALYWELMKDWFETQYPILSYKAHKTNDTIAGFAYNNELFKKGLLLSSSEAVRHSVFESGDTTLIRQWNELIVKKQQIMALEEKKPQSLHLSQLREEAEQLEKEITRSSAAYRENMRQWNITWDSVRDALKPNQVAIEYMRAPLNEDSTMYCALLLRHDSKYPELIPLFEEKQVAKLLHTSTGDSTAINTTYLYHQHGAKLLQLIWGPIEKYIQEGEQVFIAPTHMLHQIAIENLPYDSTRTMSDVYQIARLSSTRELVLNKPSIPIQKAALYGGIEYTLGDTLLMAFNARKYRGFESVTTVDFANDTTKRDLAGYLPGTKEEMEAVIPLLKDKKIAVSVYAADTACEESVKALSGKHENVLHFGTHGFFWPDATAQKKEYFSQRMTLTDEDKTSNTINPLDRCGLLFAGANRALSGNSNELPKGVDDGILTAKEISVLDFRDADIVVLSACETGLGDVSGEGVFGLQRAFKIAGAQTILMALWKVNDKSTQMLMTAFYRHYNSKKVSKREAFRLAQKEVRDYIVTKTVRVEIEPTQEEKMRSQGRDLTPRVEYKTITYKPYESPYYWAGFILLD